MTAGRAQQPGSVLLDGWPGSGLLLADDSGHVVGGHAVQVQVDVRRPVDRRPRLRERLSGPRHSLERVQGSVERGPGAGRVLMCAAPAPYEQAHQADLAPAPAVTATTIRSM